MDSLYTGLLLPTLGCSIHSTLKDEDTSVLVRTGTLHMGAEKCFGVQIYIMVVLQRKHT